MQQEQLQIMFNAFYINNKARAVISKKEYKVEELEDFYIISPIQPDKKMSAECDDED